MNTPETERDRKTRKLIETLEAMSLFLKQATHHVDEVLQAIREETKE